MINKKFNLDLDFDLESSENIEEIADQLEAICKEEGLNYTELCVKKENSKYLIHIVVEV